MLIQRFAPAKVNLMLHVVDRLHNGYHHLQTLMAFVNEGDCLTIEEKENTDEFSCTGDFAHSLQGGSTNSVILAKKWFYHQSSRPERFFKIQLEKNLPVAAGIGGGTSDAAATIAALLAWHQIDLSRGQKKELVRSSGILGADVPVSLAFQLGLGSFFWLDGSGVGELPLPVNIQACLPLVLINPGIRVNTGVIFQEFTYPFTLRVAQPEITSVADLISFIQQTHNDLEKPACVVYPDIPDIPALIDDLGFKTVIVRQSGSGATYFVVTENFHSAQVLAEKLRHIYPDWWIKVTKTME